MQQSTLKKAEGPYIAKEKTTALFLLCWLAYFAANMGRLSYTVSVAAILSTEGISKASIGLVGTGFFICYGAGQLFSGYFGDKLPPRYMEAAGLFFTAVCNLLMAFAKTPTQMVIFWCLNGIIQSALWPPIIRVISEYFAPEYRKKACVNIATTYPVATLISYALSAGLIWLFSWRAVFAFCTLLLLAVCAVWFIFFGKLEQHRTLMPKENTVQNNSSSQQCAAPKSNTLYFPVAAILLFCIALIAQGALRDGVMTWVPPYLSENFSLGASAANLSATVLPLINLAGVYAGNMLYQKFKDESKTSFTLFIFAFVFAVGLFMGRSSFILTLLLFSLITACMMGINTMFVSFVPTYFTRHGKVAFVSGLTNSMVYLGSSISTYGIGLLSDVYGWNGMLISLIVFACFGVIICLASIPAWRRFIQKN